MSGRFVRASSYRHVHGKPVKPELEYTDLRVTIAGDGNHIACNEKFFCYSGVGGGGPVVVHPIAKVGRSALQTPFLAVHKDTVLEYDFNPFNPNLLATGGEDLHIKVSFIPDEGLKTNLTESVATLEGHERRINILHFHPTANNVLASGSSDLSIKLWDIEKQAEIFSNTDSTDTVHSFDFNPDGSLIASSSKDLFLRVFDPRTNQNVVKIPGFTGSKQSRVMWRGDKTQLIGVGCSKSSARQIGMWDIKMPNNPMTIQEIDTAAGVLLPHFDADTGVLYCGGKGDGNIRYYEVVDTDPYIHFLSEFRDNASQKGLAFMPKKNVDVKQCEILNCLRLMKDKVVPISFQVPRKSADTFQKDLYPDAYAGIPSLTAAEYAKGTNKPPVKVSLDPKSKAPAPTSDVQVATTFKAQKSPADLQRELDAANAKIAQLEAELAKLKK